MGQGRRGAREWREIKGRETEEEREDERGRMREGG